MAALYAQLLLRRRPPAPGSEDAEFASYLLQGVERMHVMIDGLLEYARAGRDQEPAQAGDAPTEPSLDNGVDTVADAESRTPNLARSPMRNPIWILRPSPPEALDGMRNLLEQCRAIVSIAPLPAVAVARVPLLQIFANLIGNAVKYRTEGVAPQVEVWAASPSGGAMVMLAVRDNGIGIDPEFHGRIFAPFQRLHGDDYPGIGLGLALTRRLVERHGGRIWLESRSRRGQHLLLHLAVQRRGTGHVHCSAYDSGNRQRSKSRVAGYRTLARRGRMGKQVSVRITLRNRLHGFTFRPVASLFHPPGSRFPKAVKES